MVRIHKSNLVAPMSGAEDAGNGDGIVFGAR